MYSLQAYPCLSEHCVAVWVSQRGAGAEAGAWWWWCMALFDLLSVGHMEPKADDKVLSLGLHWSENAPLDCGPILKYLVLITSTTFALVGYCWNIIPQGCTARALCHYSARAGVHDFLTKLPLSGKWDTATIAVGCRLVVTKRIGNKEIKDTL